MWTECGVTLMFCCFVALSLAEMEDGVSYVVGAGKRDCFYRDLKKGDRMDFDLQVISGADVDISLVITSASGKELLREDQQTEISQEVQIDQDGPVEICFDNTFSTFSEKVIYFDLGIEELQKTNSEEQFKDMALEKDQYEHSSEIMTALDGIGMKFETIAQMQAVVRSKYMRHAYLQDRNLWRVTWFSTASCVIMVSFCDVKKIGIGCTTNRHFILIVNAR
ncbi:transmembrane emp24 domain-containing protein 1-like isoform X2 [Hydractinia symbiolongicarpus]|uniref:transmembrane emp24 domain-containing protein 1-like isoform X2 n=1 Tax=Hydractinia symbiolongicarpus TaxID=13093 RepID=UPI00254B1301|nr:transmembrane emp24 domain-containing protein 1-like isoform X2 [Hydractinia symbiolongicarpus]